MSDSNVNANLHPRIHPGETAGQPENNSPSRSRLKPPGPPSSDNASSTPPTLSQDSPPTFTLRRKVEKLLDRTEWHLGAPDEDARNLSGTLEWQSDIMKGLQAKYFELEKIDRDDEEQRRKVGRWVRHVREEVGDLKMGAENVVAMVDELVRVLESFE